MACKFMHADENPPFGRTCGAVAAMARGPAPVESTPSPALRLQTPVATRQRGSILVGTTPGGLHALARRSHMALRVMLVLFPVVMVVASALAGAVVALARIRRARRVAF